MDRPSVVRQLPQLHAVAIRLRDGGQGDHVIAVALDIDTTQVPSVLQLAEKKLHNLMDSEVVAPPSIHPQDCLEPNQIQLANRSQHKGASS
jgi:hypothetical protein